VSKRVFSKTNLQMINPHHSHHPLAAETPHGRHCSKLLNAKSPYCILRNRSPPFHATTTNTTSCSSYWKCTADRHTHTHTHTHTHSLSLSLSLPSLAPVL
jgi:hypothetical protein